MYKKEPVGWTIKTGIRKSISVSPSSFQSHHIFVTSEMASIATGETVLPIAPDGFGIQRVEGNSGPFGRVILSTVLEQYNIPAIRRPSANENGSQLLHPEEAAITKTEIEPPIVDFEKSVDAKGASPRIQTPVVSIASAAITRIPASTKLQNMIRNTDQLIVCPGTLPFVFEPEEHTSPQVPIRRPRADFMETGAGTAASRLGMADLGLATLSDMRAHAEMICNLKPYGPPLIADMDTGYGVSGDQLPTIVRKLTGIIGCDDGLPLRLRVHSSWSCWLPPRGPGHLKGKAVVAREEYYTRIRAAVLAKQHMGSDIVLIARTDALQQCGYEECVERLKVARELGADVGLLEGFTSKEQARKCVRDFPGWPLLLNSVENGASPLITVDEARGMGFRIMIFSFASIAPAYQAIRATFEKLKKEGEYSSTTVPLTLG
nr:2,3-dimethylmalate lyase [Quercus suber]